MTSEPVASTIRQALLGEGLRWDSRRNELLVIDIIDGRVYRTRVVDSGALSLVARVLGSRHRRCRRADGRRRQRVDVGDRAGIRTPRTGRLPPSDRAGRARREPDERRRLRSPGPALGGSARRGLSSGCRFPVPARARWPGGCDARRPDYLQRLGLESGWHGHVLGRQRAREVHAFAFDGETGTISDGRVLITVDEGVGVPDGLTVDAVGDLWVAIYGGGRVHRYSADGVLRQVLDVPAEQCTSCAFAGAGLNQLYVTTATEGWSDEQRRADPSAGIVYRFDTPAKGRAAAPFRPDPTWWSAVTSDS